MNIRPYIIHQDILYFATSKNDFYSKTVTLKICSYDLKKGERIEKYTREEPMREAPNYPG